MCRAERVTASSPTREPALGNASEGSVVPMSIQSEPSGQSRQSRQSQTDSGLRHITILISTGERPLPLLPPGRVIAVDGGLNRAIAAGIRPDVVVGDFDSVDPAVLAEFARTGGEVVTHPTDKNQTDLELALDLAEPGDALVVVGGDGQDRFDHLLGELTHLAYRASEFESITLHYPPAVVHVLRSIQSVELIGEPGSIVSIIPIVLTARGVTTTGLRWPLDEEDLRIGSTRGVSNEMLGTTAKVAIDQGLVLVIQPVISGSPISSFTK
jgi:thiamine pyrophosphokinase